MRWIALALALCACTPDFAARSDVTDLRVLAVQSDPAEAQFDARGVDDVTVTVLAVDPSPHSAFSLAFDLCAPTDSRRCDEGAIYASGSLPPQQDGTFQLRLSVPPAVLQAALESDDLKGLNGIRAQLSLTVDDGSAHGPEHASKVLLYGRRDLGPANQNPQLTGIRLSRDGADAGTLLPGETLELPSNKAEVGLRPLLADGGRERYQVTDLQGNVIELTEQPQYAFYQTGGANLDRDTAYEPLDGGAPPDGLARIHGNGEGSGTLYVVVRDTRGGESWLTFAWTSP